MKDSLRVGQKHSLSFTVPREKTVPFLYPESPSFTSMPEVFATGFLVGLMEWCCVEALAPHLDAGEGSLGTRIDISHSAPTPPGATVEVTAILDSIKGRQLSWRVSATDGIDVIGEGWVGRVVVEWDRFNAKVKQKAEAIALRTRASG